MSKNKLVTYLVIAATVVYSVWYLVTELNKF